MEVGDKLNPQRSYRKGFALKGLHQHIVKMNNPSTIGPDELLTVRFPDLKENQLIIRSTTKLTFNIFLVGTDVNRTLVKNLGRNIIRKLVVKLEGNEIISIDDYDVLYSYYDCWKTTRDVTNLERDVDSAMTKPKRGRKKKADTKINELEDNDVRDKRERLVACVLSGNSKTYLGKEYTEQQINEMDCNSINTLLNRYESVLSAQMTKSLGKSVINLYSNVACSVLGVGNQQELSTDLESDPFLNTALQRFTCDLYYRFGALLAPVPVGIITGKHYAKNFLSLN